MKHIKKILAIISLTAAAVACFAACGGDDSDVPPEHEHTFSTTWSYDEQKHWHEASCEHTWLKSGEAVHAFTDSKTGEETCTEGAVVTRTCSCGYSYEYTTEPLGHDWEEQEGVDATCQHAGYTSYYVCKHEGCGAETGKKVIPQLDHNYHYEIDAQTNQHYQICGFCEEEKPNSRASHNFGTEYKADGTNHWKECVCGLESTKDAHTYTQKKYTWDDTQHWLLCDVCNEPSTQKEAHSYDPETGVCKCGAIDSKVNSEKYFTYADVDGGLAITGFVDDVESNTVFVVPATHENKNVIAIAEAAFAGNTTLERIVLSDTIKTIGDFAFQGCTALVGVTLPSGLEKLGTFDYQVFNGCSNLKEIAVPATITYIGQNMFKNCIALSSVTFAGNVTKIDTQAFYGCTALKNIVLAKDFSYIGQRAFAKSGLTELTLQMAEDGRIAQGAFEDCTELLTATITGGAKYFASPIFAGCTKLQTLTLPFIGNHIEASKATDTHFGFIFGKKTDGSYAIPTTLTKVTVKGGEVKGGAFDGCKALNVDADAAVKVETNEFEDYTGTFTWGGTFQAPDLTVSVDHEKIEAGETVTLTITTPSYAKVAVVIMKDGAAAAENTDYTVDGYTYTLKTTGTFTFTVTSTANKVSTEKTATVTVTLPAPHLTGFTAEGLEEGRCNINTALTFTITCEGGNETTFAFKVFKGDAEAAASDYELNAAEKKITFKTAGAYRIELEATRNGIKETLTLEVKAVDPNAAKPTISSFTAEKATIEEGDDGTKLTLAVTYPEGGEGSEAYDVSIKEGSSSFVKADASYYELANGVFKAKVAGEYQITVTAISDAGGEATAEVTITATAVELDEEAFTLTTDATNGWVRVKSDDAAHQIEYTAGDLYLGGYTVTYEATNGGAPAAVEGSETAFTVKLATPDTTVITVTYTHKTATDKTYTFEIPVSFVTDIENAPILGTDPFGGMMDELYTSVGLAVYTDITDKDGSAQLGWNEITVASIEEKNTTGKTFTVDSVAGAADLKYIIVEDFDSNTASGEVAIKLTATKDGQTAAATKIFKVTAGNGSGKMNDYVKKLTGGVGMGDADIDKMMTTNVRQNIVVTKEGIVFHRTGGNWTYPGDQGDDKKPNLFVVDVSKYDNFQLDFDYVVYKKQESNQKVSFCFNLRTGAWEGWCGNQFAFWMEGADVQTISAGNWATKLDGVKDGSGDQGKTNPTLNFGDVLHIRFTRKATAERVEFKVQYSSDGEQYIDWLDVPVAPSSSNGSIGAKVNALQFIHENGTFRLGNFKVTQLAAE